ncbi:MAG: diguanylate cyclase, partial [Acidimicrobiales bacterium]
GGIEAATDVAVRLLRAVSREPVVVDERKIDVTASIGVTVSSAGATEHPEGLLREADAAMYRAKALGRDRFEVFDVALREVDTDHRLTDADDRDQSTGVSPPDHVAKSSA